MKKDLQFLAKNILQPYGKIEVSLGTSEDGKRYLKYFNKRSIKRIFTKFKKYNCSILDTKLYENQERYISTIKGKNSADYFARRCEKLHYTFREFDPNLEINAIFYINTSVNDRQGRKMDDSYLKKVTQWPSNEYNVWYGVFSKDGNLVAYLWAIKMNELCLINRILGHEEHLKKNVMYFLIVSFIKEIFNSMKNRVIMYDTFGRKENGLVLFKKRIGFKPYTVNFTA
jgi:hypothetical protein